MIFPQYLQNLDSLRNEEEGASALHKKKNKKTMRWYFLWQGISCWLITKIFFFWIFWRWKIWYFWAKILMEIWYLLITEKFLFWSFWWWEIRPFFESTRWWKDDIYLLPRSSCFELFGDGKYGLFSAKKLMERWYLLGLFELSIIFQDLGNMFFRAVPKLCRRSWYCYVDVNLLESIDSYSITSGIFIEIKWMTLLMKMKTLKQLILE